MKKVLLGVIISLALNSMVNAQVSKFQAMYIYNFSRMIEWPTDYKSGNFEIGVIGDKTLAEELKSFTANKKSGTQQISVIDFSNTNDIKKCHIIFVGSSASKDFDEVVSKVNAYNTLIISDKSALLNKGAAISFTVVEGKLKYYLNTNNARNRGLKVSSSLENMALADK